VTTAGTTAEVQLVLGVARLGEADLRGWWACHGLDRLDAAFKAPYFDLAG